jgi:type I restriction enzyme R subunit
VLSGKIPPVQSANFSFLAKHDVQLSRLGALAERYFGDDPNTALMKLRQFAELLAQLTAAKTGQLTKPDEPQSDLLRRLKFERVLPSEVADFFHQVRISGNTATHAFGGDHAHALTTLKIARQLGIWYYRTFIDKNFKSGPFVPPADPAAATQALHEEMARLRQTVDEFRSAAEKAKIAAEAEALARLNAEERAQREHDERALWEQLADEAEQAKLALTAQLQTLQTAAAAAPPQVTAALISQAEVAAEAIDIDEAATRTLIDAHLRARRWEVDTQTLRYSAGVRPAKGRNMAIAEWPTKSGPADYALFVGTRCIAVVEAKRQNKNVSAFIDQAQRYARGFQFAGGAEPIGGPWTEDAEHSFLVPFVFSANGRPYLKQVETQSGIWFRDARKPSNHRRALVDWPTPDGLQGMLEIDAEVAQADLKATPIEFGFPLRPYQKRAIEKVEAELATDRRAMLLAMATGTGKTKLAIALLYRLLSAKRFRRVCFVVDRSALGTQAAGEFATTRIVSAKTFADIFGLKGLGDITPDPETKVHICTIQGLVKRVLYNEDASDAPPVDQYDLMIVDECHRGYLLDREMSDAELGFRSQDDYVSKYRRVLEYFDAVKIGLTATPALHTVDIFGTPIFTYSYREAVIDDFLIDHDPPLQITTALSQAGINFKKGETIELIDTRTGAIDLANLPDDIQFEVEGFNKKVVTVAFNRTVADELARHIDPNLPGKTLIFAVSDAHADIIVEQVKNAFREAYGEIEDAAVRKITGSVDRVGDLIRSFRNDTMPKIAVTVDLLTTGIDVPKIENLVFLRRVNSRILYEQMLGRATRQCPEIGKETFRIFDAVDLYPHLQNLTAMKPVVIDPAISLEQLFEELARVDDDAHREAIRDQIIVKMRRRLKHMPEVARARYEVEAGETPEATLLRLTSQPPASIAAWAKQRPTLGRILDWNSDSGTPLYVPISNHPDQLVAVTRGYGAGQKPEDFLDGFTAFVRGNVNKIAALTLVVQRPRDLTRVELKSLRLELDALGYSDANLRRAWSDTKNEDIAASIIGFVRQAAIGDALTPFDLRVRAAMQRILAAKPWTEVQKKWLKRIEEQLTHEIIVDRAALDEDPFSKDGGFVRLNKIFGGTLESVLADINEELWKKVA